MLDIVYFRQTVYALDDHVTVAGEPGAGGYRLRFDFKATEFSYEGGVVALTWVEADLKLGDKWVGRLVPAAALDLETRKDPIPGRTFSMVLYLDAARLDAMASLVAAGSPRFHISFIATMVGPDGFRSRWFPGTFHCGMDVWLQALAGVGFARTVLLSVVAPESGDPSLGRGFKALEAALLATREGKPVGDVLVHCRKACDEANLRSTGLGVNLQKSKEDLTLDERLKLLHFALHAFTSPGHHEVDPEGYRRDEGRLALGITALLLEYQSRRR